MLVEGERWDGGERYPAVGKRMFIGRTLNEQESAFGVKDANSGAEDVVFWMQFYELFL